MADTFIYGNGTDGDGTPYERHADGVVVASGQVVTTIAGGTADNTLVESGGYLDVEAGGVATNTTILDGGSATTQQGTLTGVNISGPDTQLTVVSGTASDVVAAGGAYVIIGSGGALYATGGQVSGTMVQSGGGAYAVGGGSIADAMVQGLLVISSGGVASGAHLLSGAELAVFSAGSAGDTVESGGSAGIGSGGTASGLTVASGGVAVLSAGSVANAVTIAGGMVEVGDFSDIASVAFDGPGGTLQIDSGLDAGTAIAGFAAGDALVDLELPYDPFASFSQFGDVVTISAGGETASIDLVGTAGATFVLSPGAAGGGLHAELDETVACFLRGTGIATPGGDVAVEALRAGDLVRTASGVDRPVRWIGTRTYDNRFVRDGAGIMPIRLARGSLGEGVPRRDLLVSPEHAMLLDGVLVPARLLLGRGITQVPGLDTIAYFHVELDSHDILLAEGAATESFVDDHSRGMFHNAREYRLLYPDAPQPPAAYCAPRVEDGDALAAIQRRLAGPDPTSPLQGFLDSADDTMLTGWAFDGGDAVRLRVLVDGVAVGGMVANEARADLVAAGIGDGGHGFRFVFPGGLTGPRHRIDVQRASDGASLANAPMVVETARPLVQQAAITPAVPLAGALDAADRDRIRGWASEPGTDAPVALQILDNGAVLARIVANRDRPDVRAAGFGTGRHGFDIVIPGGLSPLTRHVLEIRRESDGAVLPGCPAVIEAACSFDAALETALSRAVSGADGSDGERVLSFLQTQTERLLQRRAEAASGVAQRHALQQFRRRWGAEPADPVPEGRRALVIDARLPERARDAGSDAVLSHIGGLQALGYAVSVVAADDLQSAAPDLCAAGVACLGLPVYASVEDVLRRQAGAFELVYLHRAAIAARYMHLVRQHMPRARVLFSVADLHHVRMARQAAVEQRPELLAASHGMRLIEHTAAWSADAVLTHSAAEAAMLQQALPGVRVHVVPWAVPLRPPRRRVFAARRGVAFIGNGQHAPNQDAARWLVERIMPLVWAVDPDIECLLVGSEMPASLLRLQRDKVLVPGHAPDLDGVIDRVRVTVAPLRFGSGIKGKVLASLAARTPCVMSTVAAEGMALSPALQACVGMDEAALARLILHLHGDQRANQAGSRAGAALLRRHHSEDAMLTALAAGAGLVADTARQVG